MQEPALAPVTPGAGQAQKERFGKTYFSAGPLAQIRSPLQDALDDAAAAGMQAMLPAGEHAARAQPAPVQLPLMRRLQEPSLGQSAGEAAASGGLEAVAPVLSNDQYSVSKQSSQLTAGMGTAEHADQKGLGDDDMADANNNQEATAEAKEGQRDEVPHQSSHVADAACHIIIEGQLEATAATMEPDLAPVDDLPLTSLFGTAEAAALEQHSARSAERPEVSQRPSTASASSQPASQDSNQENQLPPADDALHRYVDLAIDLLRFCFH